MSATALLIELRGIGVKLEADGGQLKYRAPADKMTPELTARLKFHKVELLAALADPDVQESIQWLTDAAELDGLICRLCTLAKFSDTARNRMLDTRKRIAPARLKTELEYFRKQVAKTEAGTYWENQA